MLDGESLFSLKGRKALITGGSRGIGRMIAQGFLVHGARVYICARDREKCEATASELGPDCTALVADLSTLDGVRQLADELMMREPRLDILVNNAGAAWGSQFESFPEHGWDKVFNINVKAPFFLTQKLLPALKAAATPERPSKVLFVGSVDGIQIGPWETYSYQASKAAVHHLTRRLAARLVRDWVLVSAIAPGAFPSEMNKAARIDASSYAASIPIGRIGGVEDIAGSAIFLASRAGDYVVGEVLAVDGGLAYAMTNERTPRSDS